MAIPRLAASVLLLAPGLFAQAAPELGTLHAIGVDSRIVRNDTTSPVMRGVPQVVWSTVVTVSGASWLRLEYGGVLLAGAATPGSDGSFVRLTSLLDGAVQTQHLEHVAQWRDTSAYFNGDSVLVELLAHQGTGDNRLIVRDAVAGPVAPGFPDSICGNTDDRVLSSDPRCARVAPVGCTAWMIDDCGHCFLSAGHCDGSNFQTLQFNVPLSTSSGAWQYPPPSDQYAVDLSSIQGSGGNTAIGNDWMHFGVFDNSTTGLSPFEANGGQTFTLLPAPTPTGSTLRVTGYGTVEAPVSPTWRSVQKTHTGAFTNNTGTRIQYTVDTTGGNSGSPVILDGSNQTIGIHTNAGCSATGGANNGTASDNQDLQTAIANPLGVCECIGVRFTYVNGLPEVVAPGGRTVRVRLDGTAAVNASTLRLWYSTGGTFLSTTGTSVGVDTYDLTIPSSPCGGQVMFYLSVDDTTGTTWRSPENAPTSVFRAPVALSLTSVRDYDFETNPPGWSVVDTSLSTGSWVRAVPADSRGPQADFDGSGSCWVTGNSDNEDVDGGPTRLVTETIDLSQADDPWVRFATWFESAQGGVPHTGNDVFEVEVSNDGGANWTSYATITSTIGWTSHQLRVRDVFATPLQFAMRFVVADSPNDSVTEAALDAFRVDDITCPEPSWSLLGTACSNATSAPTMTLLSPPAIGTTHQVRVDGVGPGIPVMVIGFGITLVPLPAPPFANNCLLLTTPDVLEPLAPFAGFAIWSLAIPNDPGLDGTTFYGQAMVLDSTWTLSRTSLATIR